MKLKRSDSERRELVAKIKECPEGIEAGCRRHGLSLKSYYAWSRRFRDFSSERTFSVFEVSPAASEVEIRCRSGRVVIVRGEVSSACCRKRY